MNIRDVRPYCDSLGHARSVLAAGAASLVAALCDSGWRCQSEASYNQDAAGSVLVSPCGLVYRLSASGRLAGEAVARQRPDGRWRWL